MRRIVGIVLILCAASFLAFGTATKESAPVNLEYWTVYEKDSALNKVMQAAAAKLQASSNITVTIVNKGDSGFRELLTASAMSQSGPDLTFNWTGLADIVTSGQQGLHLPLNKNNLFTKDELSNLLLLASCTDPVTGDV